MIACANPGNAPDKSSRQPVIIVTCERLSFVEDGSGLVLIVDKDRNGKQTRAIDIQLIARKGPDIIVIRPNRIGDLDLAYADAVQDGKNVPAEQTAACSV
jgi:hypothetical protein